MRERGRGTPWGKFWSQAARAPEWKNDARREKTPLRDSQNNAGRTRPLRALGHVVGGRIARVSRRVQPRAHAGGGLRESFGRAFRARQSEQDARTTKSRNAKTSKRAAWRRRCVKRKEVIRRITEAGAVFVVTCRRRQCSAAVRLAYLSRRPCWGRCRVGPPHTHTSWDKWDPHTSRFPCARLGSNWRVRTLATPRE
jgi:hypothetical protein